MNVKKLAASVAVVSLAVAPVAAQAVTSAAPAVQRIGGTATTSEAKLEGTTGLVVAALAAAAVIAGIIIIADDDNNDNPTSP